MTEEDYAFYEDQRGPQVSKCLDAVLSLTSLDQMFVRRSDTQLNAATIAGSRNMIIKSHVGNV